ncbi:hypothetical protein M378DRAFT_161973 [Amanita muscaria Koide BX008]|uniref:Uncharacterized protein n=1 Tax=Amanita muscaria (strain Koide BX008) TaxID=946122 RepID=A0A0C2SQV2_AMAMK|nr:hypothetical protein M378DRAFT_161973 [Amanita muscaria Koide BX008]
MKIDLAFPVHGLLSSLRTESMSCSMSVILLPVTPMRHTDISLAIVLHSFLQLASSSPRIAHPSIILPSSDCREYKLETVIQPHFCLERCISSDLLLNLLQQNEFLQHRYCRRLVLVKKSSHGFVQRFVT